MIKVKAFYGITFDQITEEFGTHISDYEFTQEVANDSYVSLDLSDYVVEELAESICWEEGKDIRRQKRLQNDLALVEYLRNIGYRDSILVAVSW